MSQSKFERERHETRDEWLEARDRYMGSIGASEAAVVAGYSPWQTVDELYEAKTGRRAAPDISGKPYVRFGTRAEDPIRTLASLDLEESYEVVMPHRPYDILRLTSRPYIFATLDGELVRRSDGARGVLEIKTGNLSRRAKEEWSDGRIPLHYFAQVCQQLLVTGYAFAIVAYRLSTYYNGSPLPTVVTGYRYIDATKENIRQSLAYILEGDEYFHQCCIEGVRPSSTIRWGGSLLTTANGDPQEEFWT